MAGRGVLLMFEAKGEEVLGFTCPGCEEWHLIYVRNRAPNDAPPRPRWDWNGSYERPTFQPSILVRCCEAVDPKWVREEGDPPAVCHSFVIDGQIQFLSDCSHALAGQTVPLKPFDEA